MGRILSLYVRLCILRAGPQDLPASSTVLWSTVAFNLLLGFLSLRSYGTAGQVLTTLLVSIALALGFLLVVLYLRGHPARFQQTATAVFGVDSIISAVLLPFMLQSASSGQAANPALGLAILIALAWDLVAIGHIFQHALELPRAGGIVVALAYLFLTTGLVF